MNISLPLALTSASTQDIKSSGSDVSRENMSFEIYNVAVIGYGMSAKVFHIPLIGTVSRFKLHAVVQRNPKPEDDAEKDHPGVKAYRSAEEMFRDAAIDVVVVTTTPESHFQLTKAALESGKHGMKLNVLCFLIVLK